MPRLSPCRRSGSKSARPMRGIRTRLARADFSLRFLACLSCWNLPGSPLTWAKGKPEPAVQVPVARGIPVADSRPAEPGLGVPRAAA